MLKEFNSIIGLNCVVLYAFLEPGNGKSKLKNDTRKFVSHEVSGTSTPRRSFIHKPKRN